MSVPFEAFLIFSTNLRPDNLGDEAFLRRIPYKIEVSDPTPSEFRELIEQALSGVDHEVVADERDYVQRIRASNDAVEKLVDALACSGADDHGTVVTSGQSLGGALERSGAQCKFQCLQRTQVGGTVHAPKLKVFFVVIKNL